MAWERILIHFWVYWISVIWILKYGDFVIYTRVTEAQYVRLLEVRLSQKCWWVHYSPSAETSEGIYPTGNSDEPLIQGTFGCDLE